MFTISSPRVIRFHGWTVECMTVDGALVWTLPAFDARIALQTARDLAVDSQEV